MEEIISYLTFSKTLVTDDTILIGILCVVLGLIFHSSSLTEGFWSKFYKIIPALLMCYFIPAMLNSTNVIDGGSSAIPSVVKYYLLPACLVLLTLSIDLKGIFNLGPKALIMFLSGTFGIVIGGPLAILIVSTFAPDWVGGVGPEAVWKGMATVAGSWIGGGANMVAMKEVYKASDELFSAMLVVDVIVANVWMAVLLYIAANAKRIDEKNGADTSAIDKLKDKIEKYQLQSARVASLKDLIIIIAIGIGGMSLGHLLTRWILPLVENSEFLVAMNLNSKLLWIILIATSVGIGLSFTKLKNYEGAGASKVGGVFLYILVASIGMKMDVFAIFREYQLFIIGGIWMSIHVIVLFIVAKMIKSPMFFLAVGSKANVGGAASAPIVASAFHPSLAPVGVLLAILGYALGTYAAILCATLMKMSAPI